MYLVDTNVISELRRIKPHGAVVEWLRQTANDQLFVAAVTIGEIQSGIEITRETDPSRATELESWLQQISLSYNVLPMDAEAFRIWGRLMHKCQDHLAGDAMLAATAKQHGLIIVTQNAKDFEQFGVQILNPFIAT